MSEAATQARASVQQALSHAARLLDRDPALAAEQAQAILAAVAHPEAELILGIARRYQGDNEAARGILEKLAAAQPGSARTRYELAQALAALGDYAPAIAALRRAAELAPGLAEAWRSLGDLLTLTGDSAGADAAYARQIRAAVNDAELMQAADALCQNRLDIAERVLKVRLKRTPTDVAAIRMLAQTATRLDRNKDAESLLSRCLELAPSFTSARHNYAIVLYRQGRAPEALQQLEQLLAQAPHDPSYRSLLAACLAATGEVSRSIEIYADILGKFANQPKLWMSYGHALRTAGQRAESVAAYRRAIALAPALGEAYWSLANLKTEPFTQGEIAAMRSGLARQGPDINDRLHLHYALGHALEAAGEYRESFGHYAEGARLRRTMVEYSADQTSRSVEHAIAVFSAEFLARHQGSGNPDPAPIFVIGLPRSGSTLVEQILSSHSAVEGTMELPDMALLAREIGGGAESGAQYPHCLATLPPADLAAHGARYLERTQLHRKLGRAYFIDKMPNNWVHTGLIHLILPNARIIDARRHPMAACFSAFKQHFARGQHFSYDLTELGRYYRDYVRLMDHFDTVLPGRVHRVRYETMVADTEAEIRRLLDYCGLDFEPACLRFWETDRAVRTASSEQVRRPIFREGLEHWRNYEPWLEPLRAALAPVADATRA